MYDKMTRHCLDKARLPSCIFLDKPEYVLGPLHRLHSEKHTQRSTRAKSITPVYILYEIFHIFSWRYPHIFLNSPIGQAYQSISLLSIENVSKNRALPLCILPLCPVAFLFAIPQQL